MSEAEVQVPQEILDWYEIMLGRDFYPVGLVAVKKGEIAVVLTPGVEQMTSRALWERHFLPMIQEELQAGRQPVGLVITDVCDVSGCEPAIWVEPCHRLLQRTGITVAAITLAVEGTIRHHRMQVSQVVFPGQWADSVLN